MAKELQAGAVDIQLAKPLEIDGAKVSVLRMREPTLDDQLAANKGGGDEIEVELRMIANLCMVAPADLRKLTLRDFKKVQVALMGFID